MLREAHKKHMNPVFANERVYPALGAKGKIGDSGEGISC